MQLSVGETILDGIRPPGRERGLPDARGTRDGRDHNGRRRIVAAASRPPRAVSAAVTTVAVGGGGERLGLAVPVLRQAGHRG